MQYILVDTENQQVVGPFETEDAALTWAREEPGWIDPILNTLEQAFVAQLQAPTDATTNLAPEVAPTTKWDPSWSKFYSQAVCRNCQTQFSTHDPVTGTCSELMLRAAHGDK